MDTDDLCCEPTKWEVTHENENFRRFDVSYLKASHKSASKKAPLGYSIFVEIQSLAKGGDKGEGEEEEPPVTIKLRYMSQDRFDDKGSFREVYKQQREAADKLHKLISCSIKNFKDYKEFEFFWFTPNSLSLLSQSSTRLCDPKNELVAPLVSYQQEEEGTQNDRQRLLKCYRDVRERIDRFGGVTGKSATWEEYLNHLRRGKAPAPSLADKLHRMMDLKHKDTLFVVIFDECHRLADESSTASQFAHHLQDRENVAFVGVSATAENQLAAFLACTNETGLFFFLKHVLLPLSIFFIFFFCFSFRIVRPTEEGCCHDDTS